MDDYLASLAEEENTARLTKKQAADEATEEYLLGRLERQRNPTFPAPSIRALAAKYHVHRGMIEWRVKQMRTLQQRIEAREVDVPPAMAAFLGNMLQGMAEVRARRLRENPRATD